MEEFKEDYNSTHGVTLLDDAFRKAFSDAKFTNYKKWIELMDFFF